MIELVLILYGLCVVVALLFSTFACYIDHKVGKAEPPWWGDLYLVVVCLVPVLNIGVAHIAMCHIRSNSRIMRDRDD